jgi:hypothetical protein
LLGTLALYASSLAFGFMWDDPVFYGHVGQAWWQTLLPTPDFQFYRPLTMFYFWQFRRPDGTFAVAAMHGFQIAFHLLNVALAYAISRRLGLARGTAVAVAALFAVYPFSQQAVAWAVPHHPLTAVLLNGAWLAYMAARPLATRPLPLHQAQHGRPWFAISLVLFGLALAVQENSATLAVIPLLYELLVRQTTVRPLTFRHLWAWRWPLIFLLVAAVYVVAWLFIPRQESLTGLFLDGRNLSFFLQGMAYPLWGRPGQWAWAAVWPGPAVGLVSATAVVGLCGLAAWRGQGRVALFGLGWTVAGILPMLVGLNYAYVSLGSRLLYTSAVGVALLWGCAWWPRPNERLVIRVASMGIIAFILAQSVWLVWEFQQLWQTGTAHLAQAVMALDEAGDGRLLFLNFPDRYAPKRPPYPVGYWGLTLAPVAVELADFQRVWTGGQAASLSRAMPWLDQAMRENGETAVDMRGVIVQPDELAELANEVDGVYITRYEADGRWQLQWAGRLLPEVAGDCYLARFGEQICLHQVQIEEAGDVWEVTLVWSTAGPLPPQLTIFTHLGLPGQPPLAQADGDTWRGALPLANWPSNRLIVEQRTLPRLAENGLVLQVGVYDWVEGQRLAGVEVDGGRPLPDNGWREGVK